MNALDRKVRSAVYLHLLSGLPGPTPDDLATKVGRDSELIKASLRRLAGEHRLVLTPDGDRVTMAHPFSGVATDYRSEIGDRSWWANCGWDAFAILALLGDGTVRAHSEDGTVASWTVLSGTVEPEGLVHFVVPARRFWDDIGFT